VSELIRQELIAGLANGRSFLEVGGLWGTVNEMVTVAARAGATETTMVDVMQEDAGGERPWDAFRARLAEAGVADTRCVIANIDEFEVPDKIGTAELVHCSGVLYHCPHPLHTLQQLRRITSRYLILGSATVPETVSTRLGAVELATGSALFIPAMDDQQRTVCADWFGVEAVGLSSAVPRWTTADYGPWWWLFTISSVTAMMTVAGFEVRHVESYWDGRATCYLGEVSTPSAA
jgi:methyltransferase family protein